MVDHIRLEQAFAQFAALLLDDFAVPDVLQKLSEHALSVLEVAGAGVALPDSGAVHIGWAAGPHVAELEDLQRVLRQGPCLDVLSQGEPLRVQLDDEPQRWPLYVPGARRLGVRSIAALPLLARERTWGVLDLYRFDDRPFTEGELRTAQVLADTATAYLVAASDRQARLLAEDELRLQALHDPLTGLPNRLLMLDRLQQALAGVARQPGSSGLLFLDLNRFKQINDAHGHAVGDRLLLEVAHRLAHALRPMDTLARFGGDEFVVLCEQLHQETADLPSIGQRLLAALAEPIALSELPAGEVVVRASVGAVELVEGDSPQDVLHHADAAMYRAKRRGGGVMVSDRVFDARAASGLRTDTELQHALERGQLRLAFQPVVALPDQTATGLEVLLRWQHPSRGLLTAGQFVPALERTGLIVPVGSWVLREVCQQLPSLQPAGAPDHWFVSINVSVQQLHAPGFLAEVAEVLQQTAVEPRRLLLEVTETALIPGEHVLTGRLMDLADLGLRVALDDFGTGFSSLSHLKHLPAHVLKIDKSFVGGLGTDDRDRALVQGTISLAHDLGLSVIAEGVEHPHQHDALTVAGCDAGQGYLYGYPAWTATGTTD